MQLNYLFLSVMNVTLLIMNILELIQMNVHNNDGTFLKESTNECVIKYDNNWYSNLTDYTVN